MFGYTYETLASLRIWLGQKLSRKISQKSSSNENIEFAVQPAKTA